MNSESQPGSGSRSNMTRLYVVIGVVTAAVFGVIALLNVPGIAYAIVAIMAGLCYTVVGIASRGRR